MIPTRCRARRRGASCARRSAPTRAQLVAESRCWYAYDLPPELLPERWGGRYRGQSQKWFAFGFTGRDEDIDIAAHEPEFVRWCWATADEVLRLAVAFKRPIYQAVLDEFGPLLTAWQQARMRGSTT